jgi:hypothetical protein
VHTELKLDLIPETILSGTIGRKIVIPDTAPRPEPVT